MSRSGAAEGTEVGGRGAGGRGQGDVQRAGGRSCDHAFLQQCLDEINNFVNIVNVIRLLPALKLEQPVKTSQRHIRFGKKVL